MQTAPPACDEMVDRNGRIRAPWSPIMAAARELGPEELNRRALALNRQASLAVSSGNLAQRLYDPLPLLLTAPEFSFLEAAVRQRATLLSRVLEDLYGPQTLLRSGAIPPALVLGEPHFLRPLHTQTPLSTPRLALFAADIVRGPDGIFSLLHSHTGIIPGLGHALSLRRQASSNLPELLRAGGIRSLRPARELLTDHVRRQAAGGLVAVLSGGAGTAAEADLVDDALLARTLGVLLIEPGDLATRNGALHMKTLSGLLNIATLIRGVSGIDLDPLEQGGRPGTGIAGAFGAIRAGVLAMLNAPGTNLAAAPVLRPYIDNLFLPLLNEPALLPPATADSLAQASNAPFIAPGGQTPAPVCFRLFAWHDGETWQVLPGGLGVPLPGQDSGSLGLKDLWVLEEQDEPSHTAGAAPAEPREHVNFLSATHLPSRLADNLFWLGRSVERLEAACRLLILTRPRLESGTSLPRDMAERALLTKCLAQAGLLPAELSGATVSGRLLRETLHRRRPVAGLLKEVGRLVNASAERLSPTMLATVRFALQQAIDSLPNEDTSLPTMLSFAATFAGIAAENMVRDGGWLFLEMGRRLERGETLAESLAILLDAPPERLQPGLALGLELADSVLSYDLRYAGVLAPGPVFALLLADSGNPRALSYQCAALRACLERLGADDDAEAARQLQLDVANLAGTITGLRPALSAAAAKLRLLSDRVHLRFFTLLPEAHTLDDGEILEAAQ